MHSREVAWNILNVHYFRNGLIWPLKRAVARRSVPDMSREIDGDHAILVSPDWLARNLSKPDVKVLDASWFLPTMGTCHTLFLHPIRQ
jgi:hypothetical protein